MSDSQLKNKEAIFYNKKIEMLSDVQKEKDNRNVPINNVGIKNYMYPIVVRGKKESQNTVANINLYVGLEADKRGTHMSRLIELIQEWGSEISVDSIGHFLENVNKRLESRSSYVEISFPYFIKKLAPATGQPGLVNYSCKIAGNRLLNGDPEITLGVRVPISSVCPCSSAISDYGAHNQRGEVRIDVKFSNPVYVEDLIKIAEKSASCEIYSVLKRPDEKYVTEASFSKPQFVEDILRDIAVQLRADSNIIWFSVSVENFESIHNHSAYASVTMN